MIDVDTIITVASSKPHTVFLIFKIMVPTSIS